MIHNAIVNAADGVNREQTLTWTRPFISVPIRAIAAVNRTRPAATPETGNGSSMAKSLR